MIFCYSLEIDSIVNGNKVDLGELGNESAPKLEQGTADVMGLFIPLLVYINNIKHQQEVLEEDDVLRCFLFNFFVGL